MLSLAVSKLGPLIDPTLYANIEIKLFNDGIGFICNENQVVPTKSQLQYARSLFITTDQSYYPDDRPGRIKQWKDRVNLPALFGRKAKKAQKPLNDLRDVILSLDKVNSVRWTLPYVGPALGDRFFDGTGLNFNSVLEVLAGLPSLDTFTFNVYYPHRIYLSENTRFGLENLHGLKSLSFTGFGTEEFWSAIIDPLIVVVRNSPELEELSLPLLNGGDGKLSLKYFLLSFPTTQPLRLRKLSLRADAQNLRIHRESGIHLKNLTNLDVVSPSGPHAHWPVTLTINDGLWPF
ncbi:hypothetical protein BT96DRAFT_365247 [Gymnopus androsaceus JB14]|uniref:F-box domain-containing protein n=1 Tax=Gymnopus androsaceus JB14 TaxID=1447944 RepID=A0A6A4GVS3_9AGAR|nr:hypothetical protein BT96DRAFT_365247 [Gymnopus androsaceus JB14]